MNKDEIELLENIEVQYFKAISICDPIEFQLRQQTLLYNLSKYFLFKLSEHKNQEKTKD